MPHDFDLERFALGELPPEKRAELEKQRAEDPQLARRMAELARSNEEILRAHPPERIAAQIRKRAAVAPPRRRFLAFATSAAALVLVAGVTITLLPTESEERTKGLTPQLHVWRQTDKEPQPLGEGAMVKNGDVLQLGYVSAGYRYGVIASLDGRGEVTLHHAGPRLGTQPGTNVLDSAYELDDAPSFERFFFIASDEKLDAEAVMAALRDLGHGRDGGRTANPSFHGKVRVVSVRVDKQ